MINYPGGYIRPLHIATNAQNKYVRYSVNGGFGARRKSHTEYIQLISASSSRPRFDRMDTHPQIGGRINPCTTSKLRWRDLPMFGRLVSCRRVAAAEVAVEFRSHFTRTTTWILAGKNTFDRAGAVDCPSSFHGAEDSWDAEVGEKLLARSLCGSSRYKKHSPGTELVKKVRDEAGRKVAADHRNKKRHRCNDRELSLTRHPMI